MRTVDGHPFECTKCGKCCKWEGYVVLDPEDQKRLADHEKLGIDEFLKRYTNSLGDQYVLKDKEGTGVCVYLVDNLCSINDIKPRQCKDYPWEYDSRCPGFGKCKEGAMKSKYEEAVKRMAKKFSSLSQEYDKAVTENLFRDLQSNLKSASVASKAIEEGMDAFLSDRKIKVASLGDLFAFDRIDSNHLIHKSTRDLWSIESDDKNGVQISRLFDNNGEPIKG